MLEIHQKKCKEYAEGMKLKSVPFCQWKLKTIFGESIFPGSSIANNITKLELFLGIFPRDQLNRIVTLENAELRRIILPATMIWEMIIFFGFLFLSQVMNLRHGVICGIQCLGESTLDLLA